MSDDERRLLLMLAQAILDLHVDGILHDADATVIHLTMQAVTLASRQDPPA